MKLAKHTFHIIFYFRLLLRFIFRYWLREIIKWISNGSENNAKSEFIQKYKNEYDEKITLM